MRNPSIIAISMLFFSWGFCALAQTSPLPESTPTTPTTCIIVPGSEWRMRLESSLENLRDAPVMGIDFSSGTLDGHRVVIGISSMGKVNASIITLLMIEHFAPDLIISIDNASTLNMNLDLGDIAVITVATQHDRRSLIYNDQRIIGTASPLDNSELKPNLEADESLVSLALKVASETKMRVSPGSSHTPRALTASLASGDQIIQNSIDRIALFNYCNRDVMDQEGAAIAQVCQIFAATHQMKWVMLRGLTDRANRDIQQDAEIYYYANMENLSNITLELIRQLKDNAAGVQAETPAPAVLP